MLLTDFACHWPPRAVGTPRAFRAAAISLSDVAPGLCASGAGLNYWQLKKNRRALLEPRSPAASSLSDSRDRRSNLETNGIDERIFSNELLPCWQSRFFCFTFRLSPTGCEAKDLLVSAKGPRRCRKNWAGSKYRRCATRMTRPMIPGGEVAGKFAAVSRRD